jgi:hypothetical protein
LIKLDLPEALAPKIIEVLRAEIPLIGFDLWLGFNVPLPGIIENTILSLNDRKFSTVNLINMIFYNF